MTRFKALSEMIYSITRIVIGFLFSLHGIEKIFGVMSRDEPAELFSLIGAAGVIELAAGGLIFVGLYTPWAAFVASGQMAFAYFLAHHPRGGWPIENDGERAVLYCFVFLYLATRESGPISLDRMIEGRRP
jgi:putative oxidoreductase|tara:strand:+ start:158 stop:550 length:393 start_codon:yes stop_codon:yes gene_type:complete